MKPSRPSSTIRVRKDTQSFEACVHFRGHRFRKSFDSLAGAQFFVEDKMAQCYTQGAGRGSCPDRTNIATIGELRDECWHRVWAHTKSGLRCADMATSLLHELSISDDYRADRVNDHDCAYRVTAWQRKLGHSNSTTNRYLAVLSTLVRVANDMGALESPVRKIARLRESRGRERVITWDEMVQLQAWPGGRINRGMGVRGSCGDLFDLMRLLWATGMRLSEALDLTWGDVDDAYITIRSSKNGDARKIPNLSGSGVLSSWGVIHHCGETQPVFRTSGRRLQELFKEAVDELGLTGVTLHTFRHTFATRLAESGATLPEIKLWLGHRDIRTSMRYTHLTEKSLDTAAVRMADRMVNA